MCSLQKRHHSYNSKAPKWWRSKIKATNAVFFILNEPVHAHWSNIATAYTKGIPDPNHLNIVLHILTTISHLINKCKISSGSHDILDNGPREYPSLSPPDFDVKEDDSKLAAKQNINFSKHIPIPFGFVVSGKK